MKKALKTEEEIKEKINEESWMGVTEAKEYFDINLIEEENKAVACVNSTIFNNYKNVPEKLKKLLKKDVNTTTNVVKIDYSSFEKRLESL